MVRSVRENGTGGLVEPTAGPSAFAPGPALPGQWVTSLAEATASFSRWLEQRGEDERIWPAFDRFLREMLLDLVGATRVRLFRVTDGGRALRPLGEEVGTAAAAIAPTGLLDHVLATGRRYIRGDWSHGALVDQLAAESAGAEVAGPIPKDETDIAVPAGGSNPVAWAFSIRSRGNAVPRDQEPQPYGAIGLVVVGDLLDQHRTARDGLDALSHLVTQFWLHVRDFECLQIARRTDRGSGVLNRADFLDAAEAVAGEAQREGEPFVLMAVAVEGLRRLDDDGHWAVRDQLIQETGRVLRRKLRNDDLVGRFSDDRFVVLLRWLDLSLSRLVAAKVIHAAREAIHAILNEAFGSTEAGPVHVRCGLAPSRAMDAPSLRELLSGALSASATARQNGQDLCVAGGGADRWNAVRNDPHTRQPLEKPA